MKSVDPALLILFLIALMACVSLGIVIYRTPREYRGLLVAPALITVASAAALAVMVASTIGGTP